MKPNLVGNLNFQVKVVDGGFKGLKVVTGWWQTHSDFCAGDRGINSLEK